MSANPNAQLIKLALGLVSVAALTGITGRLSARVPQGDFETRETAAIQVPSSEAAAPQDGSWRLSPKEWREHEDEDDDEDEDEEEEHEYERFGLRFAPSGTTERPATAPAVRTRTRRS